MGYPARMARRTPARKAGHGEIEAAPEEMHRARFAEESGAELLEHAVDVDQDLQEAPHRVRVVGGVLAVQRKPDRLRQFTWHLIDDDINVEFCERSHHRRIEARDRLSGQRKAPPAAAAGRNPQIVIDEVEVDLERAHAVRDRRGRKPARGDVKGNVPGVVEPGGPREADLADDLGPQMQRRVGFTPLGDGQFRPRHMRGAAHLSPQKTVISIFPCMTRPGASRPGLYSEPGTLGDRGRWGGRDRSFYFLVPLAKAASTSSSLIRAAGFPG